MRRAWGDAYPDCSPRTRAHPCDNGRGSRNPGAHANRSHHGNPGSSTHTHSYPDSYRCSYPNGNAYANPGFNTHTHAYTHSYPGAHLNTNTFADSGTHRHCNAGAHPDLATFPYASSHPAAYP